MMLIKNNMFYRVLNKGGGSCDSKSENWMGEVQGMWRVAKLKKVLV